MHTHEQTSSSGNCETPYKALYKELAGVIEDIGDKEIISSNIMSSATLWRWKGGVNQKAPNSNIVLTLLKKASKLNSLREIANYYGGEVKSFLEYSYPAILQNQPEKPIDKNVSLLKDEYDFHIYFMSCNERGVTLGEVIYTLGKVAAKKANIDSEELTNDLIISMGKFAEPKVQRLIRLGVIQLDDNYLKCLDNNTYIEEREGLKQSMKMISNIVNPDTWSEGTNLYYLFSDSVEPDVAIEASMMLRKAYEQTRDFLKKNKSSSKNALPFVINVAGESLIAKPLENDIKELQ